MRGNEARAFEKSFRLARSRTTGRSALEVGGASRDRTGDLLLAKQALSQLSYGPACSSPRIDTASKNLVGLGGVAPPTSPLSGVRSN